MSLTNTFLFFFHIDGHFGTEIDISICGRGLLCNISRPYKKGLVTFSNRKPIDGGLMFWRIQNWSDERLERKIRREPENPYLWDELFRRLSPRYIPKAASLCRCRVEDAEDRVQDTFQAAWQKRNALQGIEKPLPAYIFGILRLKCLEWLRKTRPEREARLQPTAEDSAVDAVSNAASVKPEPVDELVYDEGVCAARTHLNQHGELRPGDLVILKMQLIERCSHAEIAAKLGIRENAAKKRASRAVTRLSDLCEEHNITADEFRGALIGRWEDETTE
jgi:RNA polymerase sigma factor (sigma-70 family)